MHVWIEPLIIGSEDALTRKWVLYEHIELLSLMITWPYFKTKIISFPHRFFASHIA